MVDLTNEDTALSDYRSKRLRDFYNSQGAILVDAFLAANLVGGTPTARPEDLEVHPTTKEVFIAYTDGTQAATAILTRGFFRSASSVTERDSAVGGTVQDYGKQCRRYG